MVLAMGDCGRISPCLPAGREKFWNRLPWWLKDLELIIKFLIINNLIRTLESCN